jgi:hypothetical protein
MLATVVQPPEFPGKIAAYMQQFPQAALNQQLIRRMRLVHPTQAEIAAGLQKMRRLHSR